MPKRKKETKSVVMTIRFEKTLHEKLKKKAEGEAIVTVMRKAMRAYVA